MTFIAAFDWLSKINTSGPRHESWYKPMVYQEAMILPQYISENWTTYSRNLKTPQHHFCKILNWLESCEPHHCCFSAQDPQRWEPSWANIWTRNVWRDMVQASGASLVRQLGYYGQLMLEGMYPCCIALWSSYNSSDYFGWGILGACPIPESRKKNTILWGVCYQTD